MYVCQCEAMVLCQNDAMITKSSLGDSPWTGRVRIIMTLPGNNYSLIPQFRQSRNSKSSPRAKALYQRESIKVAIFGHYVPVSTKQCKTETTIVELYIIHVFNQEASIPISVDGAKAPWAILGDLY